MLGDDPDKTRAQLNTIRAKKTKFICLNDDMRFPHPDIQASTRLLLIDFLLKRSGWWLGWGVGLRCACEFVCLNDDMRFPHPDIQVNFVWGWIVVGLVGGVGWWGWLDFWLDFLSLTSPPPSQHPKQTPQNRPFCSTSS